MNTVRWNARAISGLLVFLCGGLAFPQATSPPARWSVEKANRWYGKQPWLVGSNYIPATASNELEMWQADTFDPKELIWSWGGPKRSV